MPLDRVELLARGLIRAQELSGHETPIVSLLDNDQLKTLTPEERIAVIRRYAQLRGHRDSYEGPGALSEMGSSAATGVALAFPLALLSGKLTTPPLRVLKRAKTWRAWKGIGTKVGAPLLATAAAGAIVGATAGMLQHSAKSGTNKYLNAISNSIVDSETEEEADINAAALMASTPHLSKGFASTQGMGHHYTMSNLPRAVENLTGAADVAANSYLGKVKKVPFWARAQHGVPMTREYIEAARDKNVPGSQHWQPQTEERRETNFKLQDKWQYVKGIGWIK